MTALWRVGKKGYEEEITGERGGGRGRSSERRERRGVGGRERRRG